MSDFKNKLAESAGAVEALLSKILADPEDAVPADRKLFGAMRHSVMAGGKRLRPGLVLMGAELCGADRIGALQVGAAIELIHSYSLVHDDLPAMDDDDLRRGQPTVHIAFDEATAILAGDAMLTMAFELVADPITHDDAGVRVAIVCELARAAGAAGMVGGQMRDLEAETVPITSAGEIIALQARKTGALIKFSCIAGGHLGSADQQQMSSLALFGENLGLIFQITDDLLDVEGNEVQMGKAVGKDADRGKGTLVGLMGTEGSRTEARRLADEAVKALEIFGSEAKLLQSVTDFVLDRRS
jgi:farnesyl diphosphate synthase